MKKIAFLFIANCFIGCAFSQQDQTAIKYAKIINPELASKHLNIIASDAYEGRETGRPGADKTAHYIADEFKSLGLQAPVNGSYFLDVPLTESALNISFSANGQSYHKGQDFYTSRSYADRTINASDVVFVGYGTESEIADKNLTDKVLLWIAEEKPQNGTQPKAGFQLSADQLKIIGNLQSKNPAVILGASAGAALAIKRYAATSGTHFSIKGDQPVSQKAALLLVTTALADGLLKSSGKTFDDWKDMAINSQFIAQNIKADVNISYHNDSKDVKAVDVLGYLPGSDPKLKDEVLVISAHYDHIGMLKEGTPGDRINNGADDDGSGTTGIMEIARAFSKAKKDGNGPRRSILFLGNVGEEKGLLGSEYYTDHPVFPLSNTITDLNIDMIGRVGFDYIGKPDSANYVYVIGSSMLSSDLHKANEKANTLYTHLDLDYKYDDPNDPNRFYYRSDHYNFAKHGVPIIFYFNGVHADYHGVGDEVSKINFSLLAKRTQLVFYTAWDLANADNRPVVDGKK
jgi:hypothetical protein